MKFKELVKNKILQFSTPEWIHIYFIFLRQCPHSQWMLRMTEEECAFIASMHSMRPTNILRLFKKWSSFHPTLFFQRTFVPSSMVFSVSPSSSYFFSSFFLRSYLSLSLSFFLSLPSFPYFSSHLLFFFEYIAAIYGLFARNGRRWVLGGDGKGKG